MFFLKMFFISDSRNHKLLVINTLKNMILDLLYPVCCVGCGRPGVSVCGRCESRFAYVEKDVCLYCKKMSPFGLTHVNCRKPDGVAGAMSIFYYNPFLKKLIAAIKYDLATQVWHDLSLTIKPAGLYKLSFFTGLQDETYLIPMPLHKRRERMRGFNQAVLIAKWIQEYLDIPILQALERKKNTVYQARLRGTANREKNVKNAFVVKEKIQNHNIIVIDDVLTTGETVKEVARVCIKAGASSVYVLTLAHGLSVL